MRTTVLRKIALTLSAATLVFGPWSALPSKLFPLAPTFAWAEARPIPGVAQADSLIAAPSAGGSGSFLPAGCTCRDVTVEAKNVVRDAEVRSGDAKVVNKSITYVTPGYGDTEVEVDQEAEARSGDAIAGQILAVNGGEGCSRVHVIATNVVEDAEVRSGDAIARNHSVVLLDPRVKRRGDVEIDIDQDAEAISGDAVAGQIIGVSGGGGACGGVEVDALNDVRDVDVRTGEAKFKNLSEILTCKDRGCLDEIRELLADVETVEVCNEDGCNDVSVDEFIRLLRKETPKQEVDEEEAEEEDVEPGKDSSDDDDEKDDDEEEEEVEEEEVPPEAPATGTAVEAPTTK